jgi:hypothetical protein
MFTVLMTMPHVIFGVLGISTAIWTLVELLNIHKGNISRVKVSGIFTPIFICLAYLFGGWWYVVHYGQDKAKILAGSLPAAHSFFMETKEHTFFILLLLSILLPIIIYKNQLLVDHNAKKFAATVAVLIIVLGFGMEGFGSIISSGVKIDLLGAK